MAQPSSSLPPPSLPYSVTVQDGFALTLACGTVLRGRLWLPQGAGPVPCLLEYLPYRQRDGTRPRDDPMHGYIAGHGYACLRLDIRGTGDSSGEITDEYSLQEQLDGVEAIALIAALPWCDGQVAMTGISWGGFNALQIAARQPPALKTVLALGFTDDRYATDVHYIGGCLSKDNFDWSATMVASNDLPPDPATFGPLWREEWQRRWQANVPWAHHWFAHQRRDDYWRQGSVCEDYDAIRIPVYAASGWADNYSEAVPRLIAGLRGPRLGLVGPWAHSFPHDVSVQPAIGWLQEALRWLDHWLKGRETGIMSEPLLRVWMQEAVPPATCYHSRPGRWVGEVAWPSPRIRWQELHLHKGGLLAAQPAPEPATPDVVSICSPLWVGLTAGEIGRYGDDADWPPDQRMDDGGSLVFTTAPLQDTTEIMGAARLTLRFASDKPLALVAVRLNAVAPDGASTRVTLGLLNLTHRFGHDAPVALTPGQMTEATVELDDIAQSFPAGHRMAVAVSTTYYPIAFPSPEPATLTLDLSQCRLHLPIRPPQASDARLREFDPPEQAAAVPHRYDTAPQTHPRRVTQELLSGLYTVDFPRWTYDLHLDDIGQRQTSSGHVRHQVTEGDPLSALTTTEYTVTLHRPEGSYGHHSTGRLTCSASHFRLETEITLTEDGRQVFHRRFDESFPRDHV